MQKKSRSSGFTLVEMLVVVGIVVLLTAITIPSLKTGEKSLALDREAHKVAQDIRRTLEFTLRAREFTGSW